MIEIEIQFTHDFDVATSFANQGYEPIECAFGQFGSVMGPLLMDHHGQESHREGVAIRACRDHYGARKSDPRFVVTGAPDADAILAIIALAGLVPKESLTPTFYQLVNAFDVDPIGIDLFEQPKGVELAWFNHLQGLEQSTHGFLAGIEAMQRLLTSGLSEKEKEKTIGADRARRERAEDGVRAILDANGAYLSRPTPPYGSVRRGVNLYRDEARIVITQSPVWGFDVWYRMAPVVVSYAERLKKVTVGVVDSQTSEELFGVDGLKPVWKSLGIGWGGRESIGGSPRGQSLEFETTFDVATKILEHLKKPNIHT